MNFKEYLNECPLNEGVNNAQTAKFAFAEFLKYKDVKDNTPLICINDKDKKI